MIRSLYSKFLVLTLGIMLLSAMLAFLIVNTFYHQQLKAKNDEKNTEIAGAIADYMEANPTLSLTEFLQKEAALGYKIVFADAQHDLQFFGDDFREDNLSEAAIDTVLSGEIYHGMREFPKETFVTGFFSDETANTVGVPVTIDDNNYALFIRPNIKLLFTEVHYLLGGMFVSMAIISLIAMVFVARKLVQPLTELTKATKRIGNEQFTVELPTGRGDEIGELATSFEKMAAQLQQSDKMKKQFISDVSHDFQTPLQNIQGYAHLLQEADLEEIERQNYATIIQSETERLSGLTKQLLLLTSLDTLTDNVSMKSFSLQEQIKETIQKHQWQMMEKNITLTADVDDVTMLGHPDFIEKIWENLLSNALKYTESDGSIDISLKETNEAIIFTIKDTGIGIDATHLPHLFERFYRADSARHADIEGTGLGLSIVEQVVSLHGGSVDVDSKLGKGTTFTITFLKM